METSGGDRAKRLMSLFPVFLCLSLLLYLALNLSAHLSLSTSTKRLHFSSRCFFFSPIQSSKEFSGTMTFWLFLISFALPLPLRRCHQQPPSAVFLFLLESGWNNATTWCNITQNCVRASGGTQRPSVIRPKWPKELGTGQSLWVDGAKQGRGNKACFGAVRLKVIYDVLWQAWTISTLFFFNSPLSQNAQLSCSLFLVKSSVLFKSGKQVSRRVLALRCRVSL